MHIIGNGPQEGGELVLSGQEGARGTVADLQEDQNLRLLTTSVCC